MDRSEEQAVIGKDTNSVEVYCRLLHYLKPHLKRFMCALGAMVVYGATDGAIPLLLKQILDDVFGAQNKEMLHLLVTAIVVFAILRGVFGFAQRYLAASVGLLIVQDIRNDIVKSLLNLSAGFFHRFNTGNLISRVTNDTLLVRTALTDAAAGIIRDTIRIFALVAAAFYLDPVLTVVSLVGFPLGLWPVIRFGKKVRKLSRMGQDHFGGLTSILQETIVGHKIVQAFGREKSEEKKFSDENGRFTNAFLRAEKYGALSGPTNEILGSFVIAGVILYGGVSVINGVRTQGDFIAFITALFLLYEPMKKISRVNAIVQMGVGAAERIFEILDAERDIVEKEDAVELHVSDSSIVYKDVSFRYTKEGSEADEWALRNVSLVVQPGEKLALVGMSGGGKSTLVSLLPRFYDVETGSIEIGGKDVRDVTLSSLRKNIALVDQHTFLFDATIYDNIAYGIETSAEAEVIGAAKAANAHDFISALPDGYQTNIGEQGLRLSGGQRARISIARALLRDAPILILDEATASLDSQSEEVVQAAIDRLMLGRTVMVIAHRLATVRNADKIAVLSNGNLVEFGTHEELLNLDGEYAKLYRLQFAVGSSAADAQDHLVRGNTR